MNAAGPAGSSGARGASAEAGFSLIEAIVAATLVALLAALLLGGLGLGIRVMETGSHRTDRSAQLAVAYNFMRNQLAQAQPMLEIARREGGALMFDGRGESVEFVGLTPDYLAKDGYQVLKIRSERSESGMRLVAGWRALPRWTEQASAAHETVLLDGVSSAEFDYFGSAGPGALPRWVPEWPPQRALPTLVRVRLTFADGSVAPELTVALRLADAFDRGGCGSGGMVRAACGDSP